MAGNYGKFSEEELEFLRPLMDLEWSEIVELYEQKFNKPIKVCTMRHRCIIAGLRECAPYGGKRLYSDEMDKWLKENLGDNWDTTTQKFNERFGKSCSKEMLRSHCRHYLAMKINMPRQKYQAQMPLYSTRYNSKDDQIEIKVSDVIGKCTWMPMQRYVWEKHNNKKLPSDWKVIHLDGDRTNNDTSNLYAVSNSVMLSAVKQYDWDFKNPEYRKCALLNSELKMLLQGKGETL